MQAGARGVDSKEKIWTEDPLWRFVHKDDVSQILLTPSA